MRHRVYRNAGELIRKIAGCFGSESGWWVNIHNNWGKSCFHEMVTHEGTRTYAAHRRPAAATRTFEPAPVVALSTPRAVVFTSNTVPYHRLAIL